MRIDCPSCGAAYDLLPDQVPPGRGVRCARCGVVWTPVARDDAAPPIPLPPAPAPAPALAPTPAPAPAPAPAPELAAPEPVQAAPEPPSPAEEPQDDAVAVLDAPTIVEEQPAPPATPPMTAPLRAARMEEADGASPRRQGVPVWVGWLATLLVVAALGWGVVSQRATIVREWPAAARAYGWMHLAP